jgi:hypothetical protein
MMITGGTGLTARKGVGRASWPVLQIDGPDGPEESGTGLPARPAD